MINTVYLILGGNLGKIKMNLEEALKKISKQVGTIKAVSKYYKTEAWGKTDQPDFINVACILTTEKDANTCLSTVLQIEKRIGRVRYEKWGERSIDIDILYFNNAVINTATLTVPHPELTNRKFVLVPLCDIAPNFVHPVLRVKNSQLLEKVKDDLQVTELVEEN